MSLICTYSFRVVWCVTVSAPAIAMYKNNNACDYFESQAKEQFDVEGEYIYALDICFCLFIICVCVCVPYVFCVNKISYEHIRFVSS